MKPVTHINKQHVWVLFISCIIVVLHDFILTGINLAINSISLDFQLSLNQVSWVVSIYVVNLAIVMITAGHLSQKYSDVQIFTAGLFIYIVANLIIILASSFPTLLIGRGLQGIGTGLMLPTTLAMTFKAFPLNKRGLGIGIIVCASGLGMALGPMVSGLIIQYLNWYWLFYSNLIGATIILILLLPIYKDLVAVTLGKSNTIDIAGIVIFTVLVASVLLIIMQLQTTNLSTLLLWITLAIVAVFSIILIYVEKYAKQPLIDFSLFKIKPYLGVILVDGLLLYAYIATLFLLSLYLEAIYGYSTGIIGYMFLAMALTYAMLGPAMGRLYDKVGPRTPSLIGSIIGIVGLVLLTFYQSSILLILFGLLLLGITIAILFSCLTTATMDVVPENKTSIASGIFFTIQYIGATLGAAIPSIVVSYFGHRHLLQSLDAQALDIGPSQIEQLKLMASGLQGKIDYALLDNAEQLISAAKNAFSLGYTYAMSISVFAMFVGLLLTYYLVRVDHSKHM